MFYLRILLLTISFLCSALISLGESMGNITSLMRNGRQDGGTYGKVNQLTYGYDGNRLVSVSDAVTSPTYNGFFGFNDGADQAVEYEYDANGNMTRDRNKGISSIQYNADNLPLCIQYDNGSRATYLYTSDGTKLQVRYETSYAGLLSSGPPSGSASTAIAQTHTIDYVGNKIYEDGTLKKILVDGGYVEYNGGSPVYHAYLTDHQGNVRVVVDENSTVKQVNHYYPYGGLMAESTGGDVQRYKYNGKELDRMHGLDWYDHGARHNDAAIGRWHSIDPLCEKYYDVSPYVYCFNNPVNAIDLDGKDGIFIVFPDYKISTPIGKIGGLGHAGVLLINNKTGFTKYYEYGRYDSENRGIVRSFSVPNVDIDKNGKPTTKSLNTVMKAVSEKAGHGGRIEGAYVKSDNFEAMNDYASDKLKENSNSNRKAYSLLNNNCGTFAADVLKADEDVEKRTPSIIDPRPNSIVKEFQKEFDIINYTPTKTKQ